MFAQALILGLAVQSALQADQIVWHWDRETQGCNLQQEVPGTGETIKVSRTPANNQTSIVITTKSVSHVRGGTVDGFIELSPGDRISAQVYAHADDDKLMVSAVTQESTFMRKFSEARSMRISTGNVATPELPLRSAPAASAELQKCEDRRMRGWGIDPVGWRALKSTPVPVKSLSDRLSNLDYPLEALSFRVTGDVVIRLDIGPDGHVKNCKSLNASQYKGFEFATCNVFRGARFTPALNSSGDPVTAPYVIEVRFLLAN